MNRVLVAIQEWLYSARKEGTFIVKYALPIIFFYVVGMLIGVVNIIYVVRKRGITVGHIDFVY
jgi:hypothetical protein